MNTPTFNPGYYFLHVSGQIIWCPFKVVEDYGIEEYFDSPVVVHWGVVHTQEEYNNLITFFKQHS